MYTVSIIKSKHLYGKYTKGCYLAIRALANACWLKVNRTSPVIRESSSDVAPSVKL